MTRRSPFPVRLHGWLVRRLIPSLGPVALGAKPGRVAQMVMREGLVLAAIGVAVGFPAVVLLTQLVRSQLVGVKPLDPVSLVVGTALLACSAVVATVTPALRAARVDPMVSLRSAD